MIFIQCSNIIWIPNSVTTDWGCTLYWFLSDLDLLSLYIILWINLMKFCGLNLCEGKAVVSAASFKLCFICFAIKVPWKMVHSRAVAWSFSYWLWNINNKKLFLVKSASLIILKPTFKLDKWIVCIPLVLVTTRRRWRRNKHNKFNKMHNSALTCS